MLIIRALAEKVTNSNIDRRINTINEEREALNDDAYDLFNLKYSDSDENTSDNIAKKQEKIEVGVNKMHDEMSGVAAD
jgi:hypothetical protein